MKIKNLVIENFKSIVKIELKDLGDFIIIAGPNGSGKSTIMEAVKFFKSCYGGYQQNEFTSLMNHMGLQTGSDIDFIYLLNDKTKPLKIAIELELSDDEKEFCKQNLTKLKSNYEYVLRGNSGFKVIHNASFYENEKSECLQSIDSGLIKGLIFSDNETLQTNDNNLLSWICSFYSPDSLGTFDFNDAFRSFNRQTLNNIPLGLKNITDNIKNSAIVNTSNKYNNIKNILAQSLVKSILASDEESENPIEQAVIKLFELFFPNKKYLGPRIDKNDIRFIIETGGKTHDIDFLSSGEKEILMGYLWLLSMNFNSSIFFIDEPELHLNPKLVKKLPLFYKDFVGKELKSQVWLISHSDALIDSALKDDEYTIYHLKHPNAETNNQIEKVDSGDMSLFLELVGDVAQYYPDNKTVFLESESSEFDKNLIESLFPEYTDKINFFSVGDKSSVKNISKTINTLNSSPQHQGKFFGVCDMDFDNNERLTDNCFCWDVYHIENYLLDLEILESTFYTYSLDGVNRPSIDKIKEVILEISNELIPQNILERAKRLLSNKIKDTIKLDSNPLSSTPKEDLNGRFEAVKESIQNLENSIFEDFWQDIESKYDNITEEDILKNVPGRKILRKLSNKLSPQIRYEALRQNLIAAMRVAKKQPTGIKNILDQIIES